MELPVKRQRERSLEGEKRERVEAATERQITQWAKARSWLTL